MTALPLTWEQPKHGPVRTGLVVLQRLSDDPTLKDISVLTLLSLLSLWHPWPELIWSCTMAPGIAQNLNMAIKKNW